jgi:hypothetical protein
MVPTVNSSLLGKCHPNYSNYVLNRQSYFLRLFQLCLSGAELQNSGFKGSYLSPFMNRPRLTSPVGAPGSAM